MIRSFRNADTEAAFNGRASRSVPAGILKVARRKLKMVHAANALDDLRAPPGNKLHPLRRERMGQHAIWINGKYRVCFRWTPEGAQDVEITDYHDD